jgi:hypothetical protein
MNQSAASAPAFRTAAAGREADEGVPFSEGFCELSFKPDQVSPGNRP